MRTWDIQQGDCMDLLRALPDNSIDAIVTDPPYGLGFMGKKWDALPPGKEWGAECLRVCSPGAHLVAFGGQRTIHRLICGLEDAGWEIRDLGAHQQWQGFPKSLSVGKAIDAHHGAERDVVGVHTLTGYAKANVIHGQQARNVTEFPKTSNVPATDDARKWSAFGTALKPCLEPWTLARKPLDGTVAENVLKWGTGALNIDGCRYGYGERSGWPGPQEQDDRSSERGPHSWLSGTGGNNGTRYDTSGRWPANVYACPKASRAERENGCGHLPARAGFEAVERAEGSAGLDNPRAGAGRTASEVRNHHPTVKPAALMAWLCRLVAGQPGSLILDPFAGSGTTGIAALREGFRFLGMELDPEYIEIAEARIAGDAPLFNRRESMLG